MPKEDRTTFREAPSGLNKLLGCFCAADLIDHSEVKLTNFATPPARPWNELSRLEQVLYLAEQNYKILPVHGIVDGKCTCGNPHDDKSNMSGKHPTISSWQDLATGDPDQLKNWFSGHDELNYGIYMAGSGLMAIDIDVEKGGWDSWCRLDAACEGEFPKTIQVLTGTKFFKGEANRGAHMYFKSSPDLHYPANLSKAGYPSIDLRHNGYILGPGSMHKSGTRYEWAPGCAPWEIEAAELPGVSLGYLMPKVITRKRSDSDASIGDEEWKVRWAQISSTEVKATSYAAAALKNTCKELSEMLPGSGRNDALNAKAFSLGRLVGGGQLSLIEAKNALRKAAVTSYKSEYAFKREAVENTLRTWGGGFETGALEPKYPNEISEENLTWIRENFAPGAGSIDDLIQSAHEGFFKGKDLQRLVLQNAVLGFGPIEVGPGKTLWSYSDGYWKRDGEDLVINRTGRLLGDDARPAHTTNLIHFMKTEPETIKGLGPEGFINLKNGMLNWRTGELMPHATAYHSTVQLPHNWTPDATCPTVDAFLDQVLHADLIDLIWEIIGVCIYTGMGFQQAIFFDGGGRNGKGTLIRLIEQLIPGEFVSHIELQSFTTDKFAKAQLFNKIFNVVGDLSPKALTDTSLFKQLTGQDKIAADYKYGATFNFICEATLLFAANKLPHSSDTTHGFFERMLIVPFNKVTLQKHEVDHSLEPRMWLELEGVLVKAVEGLRRAKKRGHLMVVERCAKALEEYRMGTNLLSRWAASAIEFTASDKDRLKHTDLYDLYLAWCKQEDIAAVSSKEFYEAFGNFSNELSSMKTVNGYKVYTNVRVIE